MTDHDPLNSYNGLGRSHLLCFGGTSFGADSLLPLPVFTCHRLSSRGWTRYCSPAWEKDFLYCL